MSDDTVPTVEDRALANEALNRAVTKWTHKRLRDQLEAAGLDVKMADNREPVPPDYARFMSEQMPALKSMMVETEIAIATARVRERERCQAIARNAGQLDEVKGALQDLCEGARLRERERCAKIAESLENWSLSPKEVAAKIREEK